MCCVHVLAANGADHTLWHSVAILFHGGPEWHTGQSWNTQISASWRLLHGMAA